MSWISRGIPVGARHAAVAEKVWSLARGADVVYATSMIGRAALGATAARKPLVIKLTTDEAYERAQRRGLYDGDLDAFQHAGGDLRIRALRRSRDTALRQATRVICPSAYLRDIAVSWGVPADRALVIPNPAPDLPAAANTGRSPDRRRRRRPHARFRRADRPPEVAGGGAGGGGAGGRRLAARRGRRARA